jgi:hypothetical protein
MFALLERPMAIDARIYLWERRHAANRAGAALQVFVFALQELSLAIGVRVYLWERRHAANPAGTVLLQED